LENFEMKKTLVAIAALAVVGAASAQSSVTLYGRIDASIASDKTELNGVTTADGGVLIRAGGHTGNRWGLKGSEDLGGGLKANFQLEQGFNVDDGTASSARQFHRQAWVGLSGGFGSVKVGRQYDMTDNMYAQYDPAGYSGYSAMGYAFNAGSSGDFVGRQDNAVIYSTPSMGGFGASFMWAPGENKTPAVSAGKAIGFLANYSNGPLGVGGSWQSNKATGATAATTNMGFGASYDIGVAKLFGQYQSSKVKSVAGTPKDNGWQLGAVMPVGAASLTASYASEKTKVAGAKTQDAKAFMLMGKYDLSKRTYVYAAYRGAETDPVGAANTTKNRRMGLGLVHNF
jgi:predicted porin